MSVMANKEIVVPKCGDCGGRLTVLRYRAADGDMLFAGGSAIIESHTAPVQTRALYLCALCDRIELMPRVRYREEHPEGEE